MDALPPAVTTTLRELGRDALGGAVTMSDHAEVENVVVMRCEELDPNTWLAVIPVHSDASAAVTATDLGALMEPPHRVVAVGLLDRCTTMRNRADVDFFTEAELHYNATRHEDQPSMRRLTPEEVAALLEAMELEDTRLLPAMASHDIIVRYYGFRKGDVVRCDRHTPSGEVSYYRCVT